MSDRTFRAGFLFAGLGAGARGFLEARARLGEDTARFVNVGGIDIDAEACADFERLTGAPALRANLATLTPAELRAAWGDTAPDCIFLSPPCKGFSGLLSAASAAKPEYQALNRLVLQGVFLLCETWPTAPSTIVLENVPRIVSRGAELLRQVKSLLAGYGYRFDDRTHDCGTIGGLAQHRKRYLLVARRPEAVPAFIYRPPVQRVRGCGEVLGTLPVPLSDDARDAGVLHLLPKLSWLTWLRLALIPPGGDWRDLPGVVPNGAQRRSVFSRYDVRGWTDPARTIAGEGSNGGFAVADPRTEWFRGSLGVLDWANPAGVVTGAAATTRGAFSVADPRLALPDRPHRHGNQYRVTGWEEPSGTVTSARSAVAGTAVADPRLRLPDNPGRHWNKYRVTPWDEAAGSVIGSTKPYYGAASVADPRLAELVGLKQTARGADSFKGRPGLMAVNDWDEPTKAVTGSASVSGSNGTAAVADPRLGCSPRNGVYGVVGWEQAAGAVIGNARVDNGPFAVADPRETPAEPPIIEGIDGTWHRPMSTLELAALQGLPTTLAGEPLSLAGKSVGRWRERIGNAVPVGAAKAIAESILLALLAGALGTWTLGSTGIWVRRDGRTEHEWRATA